MKTILPICTKHVEICHPFRYEIRPFFEEFKPASLSVFVSQTRDIDVDIENDHTQMNDIALDKQYDGLENISVNIETDSYHVNPNNQTNFEGDSSFGSEM